MIVNIPFTEKNLKDWAGWRAFRDGKSLFTRGVVEKVDMNFPYVSGTLNLGPRGMRSKFEVLKDGLVENHCPCRENQERGLICSHLVAMGLELIQKTTGEEDQFSSAEAKRLAELEAAGRQTITRVKRGAPNAVPARIRIELGRDWKQECAAGFVSLSCYIDYADGRFRIDEVSKETPFSIPRRDENVLYVLEELSRGPIKGELKLSLTDFINILRLHHGKPLFVKECERGMVVHNGMLDSSLKMDLDRDTGELLLSILTDAPGSDLFRIPFYILGESVGWVCCSNQFWPLTDILPAKFRDAYRGPASISREDVPAFLRVELPKIEKYMVVHSEITEDLFTMEPAVPHFRLLLKGSPASLAATLYARYGDHTIELVAGRADTRGNFAIPDEEDLLSYRVRNMAVEKQAVEELALTGFVGRAGDTLKNIVGPREVLNFLGGGVPKLRRLGWQVELEGRVQPFATSVEYVTPVVHIGESDDSGFFDVSYDYELGQGQSISERDIQRALMKGDSYIERNGRTILLDSDAIQQAREVFEDCASGPGDRTGTLRMSGIYGGYVQSSLQALDGIDVEAAPSWMEKARQQNEQTCVEEVALSPHLTPTLRSYQRDGVNWLSFLEKRGFCGILADEMGLGKTLQALAWIQLSRHHEEAQGNPVLVICPTSLVENWAEEAAKFVPNLKVVTLHGIDRHEKWESVQDSDLIISSYALMRRDIDKHLEYEYSVVILDEAQHIKNRSTQNALSAKQLKASSRLVLTGTPIENSVADLWSIMDFLMPGYLGDHKDFHEFYELPIAGGGSAGDYAQSKLRRKLHPFLMRRLKKEVAKDLPPKIERIAPCSLTKDQQMVYSQLLEDAKRKISNMVAEQGFNKSRMEILTTLLRLRQTCCHVDLLKLDGVESEFPSAKMDIFFELLDEALDSKHRVLVFSQFTSMLAILRKEMEQRDLAYCYLDGSTKDRQDVVKEFNRNRDISVFLMSLKAGGTGLNLTGADMVIHFDPWWNPAVEDQATDRAHRIGQNRTVYSVKLITKGTVEEKVVEMQQRKKSVIDATLTTDEQVMQKLTWEDVQELLSL